MIPSKNTNPIPQGTPPAPPAEEGKSLPTQSPIGANPLENVQGFPTSPPDLSNLLGSMGGSPLETRTPSTSPADVKNLLMQDIKRVLENYTSSTVSFQLKDLQISSTTPAVIDASITCKTPKGKRGEVKAQMEQIYSTILTILTKYIDENDADYKNAKGLNTEQQQELEASLQETLKELAPDAVIEGTPLLTFRNDKPILSLSPSLGLDATTANALLERAEALFVKYNTVGILFSGTIEFVEEEAPDTEMKIHAQRTAECSEPSKDNDDLDCSHSKLLFRTGGKELPSSSQEETEEDIAMRREKERHQQEAKEKEMQEKKAEIGKKGKRLPPPQKCTRDQLMEDIVKKQREMQERKEQKQREKQAKKEAEEKVE